MDVADFTEGLSVWEISAGCGMMGLHAIEGVKEPCTGTFVDIQHGVRNVRCLCRCHEEVIDATHP